MRQGPNNRRSRGRGGNSSGGGSSGGSSRRQNVPLRHQTFDSNGPDVRIRGNAWQINEKYLALARDAAASGDRVTAENYLQHAEHYFRIISQIQEAENRQRHGNGQPPQSSMPSYQDSDDEDQDSGEDESEMTDERAALNA